MKANPLMNGSANGSASLRPTSRDRGPAAPRLAELEPLATSFAKQLDDAMASYYAASVNRYMPAPIGVAALGSGADYHYRLESEFMRMIERARLIDRDDMAVSQGVRRLAANVVREGFRVSPMTGDDDTDAELRRLWKEWGAEPDACDIEGERSFHEFELAAIRQTVSDGDLVFLPTRSGHLQALEAHRMRSPFGTSSPHLIHGVEVAPGTNRRAAYHLTLDDIQPGAVMTRLHQTRRYAARDAQGNRQVMHVYDPRRLSQRRGVTAYHPVLMPINYHSDLQFATLVKAKVASFVAIFRKFSVEAMAASKLGGSGDANTRTMFDGSTRQIKEGVPGLEMRGVPGEELEGFAPNIPNAEFFQHSSMLLGIIAANLDLPLIVFMLDASATNFSGWRGAMDQARMRFRDWQALLIRRLHRPTYRWKVREWIRRSPALQRAARGRDLLQHEFKPPRWPYIEPAKDAAANDLRVRSGQASEAMIAAENGIDHADLVTEVAANRAARIEAARAEADRLNEGVTDPAERVHWREIAYSHETGIDLTKAVVEAEAIGQQPSRGTNNAT